ncbi:RNA-binding S4 domain-containing protein [Pseudoroseicyclus aestuarii]|uniref:Heat shock protein Hsp15 n=1 Tax=Pseudoroseicyclus aestuarii TaxID=1795041 RepID=A0A318T1G8_9RHOB|nr:RNA-binding S4 domain-containing protein [Pseudoroseicyclus aestuarii]PYE85827.1 heat shock protein Hsp15 [Pseudoroseicyclus aestuarii]
MARAPEPPPREVIRLDRWLYHARFFRSRAIASALVSKGRVRVNGDKAARPSRMVGERDVLTFPQAGEIRVIRVLAPGTRRGPASEARALYEDLDAPAVEAPDALE